MKKAILTGTAILLALFALSPGFVSGQQDGRQPGAGVEGAPYLPPGEAVELGRTDPFAPLERLTAPNPLERRGQPALTAEEERMRRPAELRLDGIVWSDRRPMAFINKKLVETGDLLHGWEVAEILRDRVRIKNGEKTKILKIQISFSDRERSRKASAE